MKLQNDFIYNYVEQLYTEIIEDKSIRFPAKINYSIQKNFKTLFSIYQEISEERENICQEYSTSKENNVYIFADEPKRIKAEKELSDLMMLEQEVNIIKFKLDDLGNLPLTFAQMDLLMFMFEDDN